MEMRVAPWVFVSLAGAMGGCTVACSHAPSEGAAASTSAVTADATSLLKWGSGEGAIGLRPNAADHLAQGASAIAIAPSGDVFVLDGVNERVLAIGKDGETRTAISNLPSDADDIAIAPDGAVAVYGALTQKIMIFDHGQRAQEIAIPRVLHDVDRIAIGPSRRVSFRTGLGETLMLGSPRFPLPLDVTIASKREGAAILRDGTGVRAEVTRDKEGQAHAALVRVAKGAGERAEIVGTYGLDADALHVIGAAGDVACARLEHVSTASGAISVKREAACIDMDSNREVLRVDLGAPGMYTPRGELAVGGVPAVLAFAYPEDDGLRITTYAIGGGVK